MMPPGQQCENQGFARLAGKIQIIAGTHPQAEATRLQFLHQGCVVTAPSRHHHLDRQGQAKAVQMLQVLSNNRSSEGCQCGHLVFGGCRLKFGEPPFQILPAEELAPGRALCIAKVPTEEAASASA